MALASIAKGAETRTRNMHLRRENILAKAGEIIAREGIKGLTLGKLAKAANVTVPTIHNLIGPKNQIFSMLVEEMVSRIESVLADQQSDDPIVAIETFVENLIGLYEKDEALYRAAFVAGEHEKIFTHSDPDGIFKKSLSIAEGVCRDAKAKGYLYGTIPTTQLANRLFNSQRLARHDWMHGYTNLAEYRLQVLMGMFITMAADAVPEFHARLVERIVQLNRVGNTVERGKI